MANIREPHPHLEHPCGYSAAGTKARQDVEGLLRQYKSSLTIHRVCRSILLSISVLLLRISFRTKRQTEFKPHTIIMHGVDIQIYLTFGSTFVCYAYGSVLNALPHYISVVNFYQSRSTFFDASFTATRVRQKNALACLSTETSFVGDGEKEISENLREPNIRKVRRG